jgi:hypothetical protein
VGSPEFEWRYNYFFTEHANQNCTEIFRGLYLPWKGECVLEFNRILDSRSEEDQFWCEYVNEYAQDRSYFDCLFTSAQGSVRMSVRSHIYHAEMTEVFAREMLSLNELIPKKEELHKIWRLSDGLKGAEKWI